MKSVFETSLDTTAKLLTVGIALLFIGIAIGPLLFSEGSHDGSIVTLGIFLFIYGTTFLYSPRSYELDETNFIIKRPIGNIVLNRSEIKSVMKTEKSKLSWAVRTFGVGGLFGYFGKFWNGEFGHMTWYATRMDHAILITTNEGKKIVVTPNEQDQLLSELDQKSNER